MGDLSRHFDRSEFACQCGCGRDTVDSELLDVIEDVHTHFGHATITISSGNRCWEHNEKVGGSERSQHLYGRAADIIVAGVDPELVYSYVSERYVGFFGVGKYETFTHIDTRTKGGARW